VPKNNNEQQAEELKKGDAPAGKKKQIPEVVKTGSQVKETPLRCLVLAETNANFFTLKKEGPSHSL